MGEKGEGIKKYNQKRRHKQLHEIHLVIRKAGESEVEKPLGLDKK